MVHCKKDIAAKIGPCEVCSKSSISLAKCQGRYMCFSCQRKWDPPRMTIAKVPGGYLWNVEAKLYESKEICEAGLGIFEYCGWFTRSIQQQTISHVPRQFAKVYYFEWFQPKELHRTFCGRCCKKADLNPNEDLCLSEACKPFALDVRTGPPGKITALGESWYYRIIEGVK